jgi:hypothetical protein
MKTRKGITTCIVYDCPNEPYLGGRCKEHYEEDQQKRESRESALHLLHLGMVDDQILTNNELKKKFQRISPWWKEVCFVINNHMATDKLSIVDANGLNELCISAAREIVEAERSFRTGDQIDDLPFSCLDRLMERIDELENKIKGS